MGELLLVYSWWKLLNVSLPTTPGGWGWLMFGLSGNAVFCSRFLVQWIHSERHGESRIPTIFWYQSMAGTLILLVYFLHDGALPGIVGYVFNLVPYTRNLMLIHKKKRLERHAFPVATGAAVVAGAAVGSHPPAAAASPVAAQPLSHKA